MRTTTALAVALSGSIALASASEASTTTTSYEMTHERSGMENVSPTPCPPEAPQGAVCALRTVFIGDLHRAKSDRSRQRGAGFDWTLLQQLCIDGACHEILWDMGTANRHALVRSDRRHYESKPLMGMKGTYVYTYEASGPPVVNPPEVIDTAIPPCITKFVMRKTSWESTGTATIVMDLDDGDHQTVTGDGWQTYTHKIRHTTRIDGCVP